MDFSSLYPQLQPWVENVVNIGPGMHFKNNFAQYEVGHIVSLFVLGGCLIMINLRLLGAGLTTEPVSVIYRQVKWWMLAGVIGVIGSGVLIGWANAERLYASVAFLVKMISLLAAIIFTYLVTVPVAKADGKVGNLAKVAGAIAFVLWAVSIWIFADLKGSNAPGVFHLVFAGALIVAAATAGKTRWVFLGGLVALVVAHQAVTHLAFDIVMDAGTDKFNATNIWFVRAEALWVLGFAGYQIWRTRLGEFKPLAQMTAYASILIWITVAAAGRWIAFT